MAALLADEGAAEALVASGAASEGVPREGCERQAAAATLSRPARAERTERRIAWRNIAASHATVPAMARGSLLLFLALLTSATLGCGRVREISRCKEVVRQVNGALDEIEKLAAAKPVDEPRIAKRYGELAKALVPHAQGESPLAVAVRDYVAVLQSTEAAVSAHAAASGKGRVADARRDLEKAAKRERAAASRLETECLH